MRYQATKLPQLTRSTTLLLALLAVLLLLSSSVASSVAQALPPSEPSPLLVPAPPPLPSLRGLSTQEVTQLFGAPDSKQGTRGGESWRYGGSSILFSENTVAGWSDMGELRERQVMHSLQFEGGLHGEGEAELPDPGEEEGWKNAWTRQQRIPAEEVVDEILTDTPTLAKKVEPEE